MAVDPDHNDRTTVQRRDPLLGEVFDRRFRIEARIAAGGFGAIYHATHVKSGHQLALKVLHAKLTNDAGVVARFRREGAALTRLRDPHTITAYELGESPDGTLYIVMELLHGESLYERFRARGRMPWQRVVAIARAVCSSLTEAHALGIIHRDLKPTNIHLEPHGDEEFVKVLDFGIAKIVQDSDIDSSELTYAGQMIGTLDYMSPEQMVGGMCTPASDLYSLGVVMYEMIAGKKPFDEANSAAAALAAVLTTTPARLSTLAVVPPDVDRIVMRCLERQHADRFQSAAALAATLDELLASGDEAVTTVDLTHSRGALTTIKGMRPARLPTTSVVPTLAGITPPRPAAVPAPGHPPDAAMSGTAPSGPTVAAAAGAPQVDAPASLPPRPTPARHTSAPHVAPLAPRATPATPRPAASVSTLTTSRPGSAPSIPKMTPSVPRPAPLDPDATLIGLALPRGPASRPTPAGPLGVPLATPRNLREAYPTIHRPLPSPMRPQTSPFDDRQTSSVGIGPVFDMSRVVQRNAVVRRLALAIGLAVLLVGAFLLATHW